MQKVGSQKKNYLEKESDEINQKDMSDEKDSLYHISKNEEEQVSNDIEIFKVEKLNLKKQYREW